MKTHQHKGSIGHAFTVCTNTENQNKVHFAPFSLHEISSLIAATLEHPRYDLTDVPPQPNSQPNNVSLEMISKDIVFQRYAEARIN